MKSILLLVGLLALSFTVQPQSVNGVPNQVLTLSGSSLPAGCSQFPCEVFHRLDVNQTAQICCPSIYTPTVAGTYSLECTYYVITAATSGGGGQCGYNWKTFVGQPANSAGASVTVALATAGAVTQNTIIAHLDGTDPVIIFANYGTPTGTATFNIDWVIKRLQ